MTRVYDTLGLISPVTVVGRIIMQSIWGKKLNWDQEVPPEIKERFWQWVNDLKNVTAVTVPRPLFSNNSRPQKGQLHACCDSSLKARGAVAYCRTEDEIGKVTISLLGSKTRVAPLQDHSVARLELLAAETAVKLAQSIIESLKEEIDLEVFFWTDSMVVLYWISGDWYMWKTRVSNRCRTIQEAFPRSEWRHIAGKENHADLCYATFGCANRSKNDSNNSYVVWETRSTTSLQRQTIWHLGNCTKNNHEDPKKGYQTQ